MQCNNCQVREARRLCGACAFVPYCSEACADQHWPVHALEAHLQPEGFKEAVADEILPGLWLGGIKALHHLDELGVGAVVTAIQQDKPGVEKMLSKKLGDRPHLRFKWYDSPDQELTLGEMCRAASFIEQFLPSGVLVHCWAGHSRSVAIVVFYLMKKTQRFKSVADTLAFIRSKRPYISPNAGFVAQLEKLVAKSC
jgi:hypothetical protein